MFYCKKCKKYFCQECKNIIFNLANNEEELIKYLVNSQNIKIYCNDCEETYMLNEIYPNHINHDINFITINEKNKKKLLLIGDRGCGLGCSRDNILLNDFLNEYNVNDDLKNIIKNHEPVLLQGDKVLPFKDTLYIYPTYNVYILNETSNIMLDLWNEGNNTSKINLELNTSEKVNKTMFYNFTFNNLKNKELNDTHLTFSIYNSDKLLSDDEMDELNIELLYDDYIDLDTIPAKSKKNFSIQIPISKKDLLENFKERNPYNPEITLKFNHTFLYVYVSFKNFLGEYYYLNLLNIPISKIDI